MFGRTSEEEKAPLSSQALVLGLELLYHRSQNDIRGTYLVVQWLRVCLPKQGHRFDPWCGRIPGATGQLSPLPTTKPMYRNY